MDWINKIHQGDTLTMLKQMPSDFVDTIVTSPPYWGLRDYGESTNTIWDEDENCDHKWQGEVGEATTTEHKGKVEKKEGYKHAFRSSARYLNQPTFKGGTQFCQKCGAWYGQLGLEPTLDLYIEHLFQIITELKRVLKPTGVMFWNHGDCYGGSMGSTGHTPETKNLGRKTFEYGAYPSTSTQGKMTPKCMMMQNYRLITRLIDEQGWILRNVIIWNKPNHMPSSVKDRFSNGYEPIFMLVKNTKTQYYYNIKTGLMVDKEPKILKEGIDWDWKEEEKYIVDCKTNQYSKSHHAEQTGKVKTGKRKKVSYWHSVDYWFDLDAVRKPHLPQSIERAKGHDYSSGPWAVPGGVNGEHGRIHSSGKNPGDVWTIPTQPFPEAHFAVFPEKLIEPMILSSCPQWICKKCGKVKVRIMEKIGEPKYTEKGKPEGINRSKMGWNNSHPNYNPRWWSNFNTLGWTDCKCDAGWKSGIVLDPFMGAGTTAVVARKFGRNYIGIELNPEYVKIANKRLMAVPESLFKNK